MLQDFWNGRRSWMWYAITVLGLHVLGIIGLFSVARYNYALWSLGFLAYTFGLRHAFDADHIAAIDNTVRKLVEQKRNPLGVGFFFSLGHSSVVFLMVLAIALSMQWIQQKMPQMKELGGGIGTTVSGSFLLVIGFINLLILISLYQMFLKMRSRTYTTDELEQLLLSRGFLSRLINPFYKFISSSWHVYPLGFLFGLGFDTATEVGLLAISAGAIKNSISMTGILSFPILFAAGMSLFDTLDGMFMTHAYRWAFSTPLRKIYYNITVTSLSVFAALGIGLVELSQVLAKKISLQGAFWEWLQGLDFGDLGYILVVLFVLAWGVSYGIWKFMKIEERWRSLDV